MRAAQRLCCIWNNVAGIAHPKLGGYKIKLVREVYFKSHFGIPN